MLCENTTVPMEQNETSQTTLRKLMSECEQDTHLEVSLIVVVNVLQMIKLSMLIKTQQCLNGQTFI